MSEWAKENLGSLVTFQKGRKVETSDFQKAGFAPYLGAGSLTGENDCYADTGFAIKANENDILMLWDGERSGLVGHKLNGVVSSTVSKLTPNTKIGSDYLYYYLLFNFDWIQGRRTGTGVPHVPKDLARMLKVSYPECKGVQFKISSILSAIDRAIEKTESLIAKYQKIKSGLMHDLFTRGVTADGKLRPPREQAPELYRETPVGWMPMEWDIDQVGERIAIIDPNPSHRYPEEVEEGVPICSTENFDGEDFFLTTKSKLVHEKTFIEQNNRCRFEEKDVVFARKGKIGLARRYGREKKVFSHTVVLLKPKVKTVNSDWLLWIARSYWLLKTIDVTMNTNSGVPTLGIAFIQQVRIPFPPEWEQAITAQRLDAMACKITSEKNKLEKLKKQKAGLMQDLLTGKVPVKIDEPDQEFA